MSIARPNFFFLHDHEEKTRCGGYLRCDVLKHLTVPCPSIANSYALHRLCRTFDRWRDGTSDLHTNGRSNKELSTDSGVGTPSVKELRGLVGFGGGVLLGAPLFFLFTPRVVTLTCSGVASTVGGNGAPFSVRIWLCFFPTLNYTIDLPSCAFHRGTAVGNQIDFLGCLKRAVRNRPGRERNGSRDVRNIGCRFVWRGFSTTARGVRKGNNLEYSVDKGCRASILNMGWCVPRPGLQEETDLDDRQERCIRTPSLKKETELITMIS